VARGRAAVAANGGLRVVRHVRAGDRPRRPAVGTGPGMKADRGPGGRRGGDGRNASCAALRGEAGLTGGCLLRQLDAWVAAGRSPSSRPAPMRSGPVGPRQPEWLAARPYGRGCSGPAPRVWPMPVAAALGRAGVRDRPCPAGPSGKRVMETAAAEAGPCSFPGPLDAKPGPGRRRFPAGNWPAGGVRPGREPPGGRRTGWLAPTGTDCMTRQLRLRADRRSTSSGQAPSNAADVRLQRAPRGPGDRVSWHGPTTCSGRAGRRVATSAAPLRRPRSNRRTSSAAGCCIRCSGGRAAPPRLPARVDPGICDSLGSPRQGAEITRWPSALQRILGADTVARGRRRGPCRSTFAPSHRTGQVTSTPGGMAAALTAGPAGADSASEVFELARHDQGGNGAMLRPRPARRGSPGGRGIPGRTRPRRRERRAVGG